MPKFNILVFFSLHVLLFNFVWITVLYLLLNSFIIPTWLGQTILDVMITTFACIWVFAYLPFCFLMVIQHINEYYGINLSDMIEEEIHPYIYKRKTGAVIIAYLFVISWIGFLFFCIHYLEKNYTLPF